MVSLSFILLSLEAIRHCAESDTLRISPPEASYPQLSQPSQGILYPNGKKGCVILQLTDSPFRNFFGELAEDFAYLGGARPRQRP